MAKMKLPEPLFDVINKASLRKLQEAIATHGPSALTDTNAAGYSLHAHAFNNFVLCFTGRRKHKNIDRRRDCIQWLIEQRAPFTTANPWMSLSTFFCESEWSGATPRAEVLADLMAEYIQRGYLNPNEVLTQEAYAPPHYTEPVTYIRLALIAAICVGNPLATRVLLENGAVESAALESVDVSDLAHFAASVESPAAPMVVATINEFHMLQRVQAGRRAAPNEFAAPAARRSLGV